MSILVADKAHARRAAAANFRVLADTLEAEGLETITPDDLRRIAADMERQK